MDCITTDWCSPIGISQADYQSTETNTTRSKLTEYTGQEAPSGLCWAAISQEG